MAGAGYKLFATGDVLTAAQVNTYLNEQTVMVFADSAARTTALSGVLAEGMMSYLQDSDSVEVYDGSAWTAVGGGGSSPLTTKGDLYTFSTVDARLGVGANGTVLTAASGEATGLQWAAPAAPAAVGCSLYMTASQSLANATQTTINWTNEIYDTNSLHDNSVNNDRITIPSGYGGKWLFTGSASFNSNATGYRFVRAFVNDTGSEKFEYINSSVGSGNYGLVWFSFQLSLSAADYVNFDVYQNSGGSLNLNGAPYATNVQAYYLGA
jgi:hypothetical protein